MDSFFIITSLLKIVGILAVILTMVSYAVYAERRVSAFVQDRLGPNRVGPAGLLQPIADMFKLLLKEDYTPRSVNTFYYWLPPCLSVLPALITRPVEMAGRNSHGHFLSRVYDRNFRRDKSTALRSAGSGAGTCRRLQHRIQLDEIRLVFSRRIRRDDYRIGSHRHIVLRRLAFPGNSGRVPGVDFRPHQRRSLFRKSCCHDFCFHLGALYAAAFSLGPAYATGLALFFRYS